jgi:hypothetical protein
VRWAVTSDPFLGNSAVKTSRGNGYTCKRGNGVLSTPSASRSYIEENRGNRVKLIVGSEFCTALGHRIRGITIVNIRYEETSSKYISEKLSLLEAVTRKRLVAVWRRLGV